MQEIGQVLSVQGDTASVRVKRSEACAHCGKCGMLALDSSHDIVVEADNHALARAGDTVRLELEPGEYLTAAFVVYVFPILAAALGYAILAILSPQMGMARGTMGMLGALFGFVASYALIRAYDQKARREGRCKPQVVEIVSSGRQKPQDEQSEE